jgi:hypothetical protein
LDELLSKMPAWDMTADREQVFEDLKEFRQWLNARIHGRRSPAAFAELGLDADHNPQNQKGPGRFEVHSARPARRIGPDGQHLRDLIVVITQGRPVFFKEGAESWNDYDAPAAWDRDKAISEADFWYRGGCTLIVDLQTGVTRYCIRKNIAIDRIRFQRQLAHEWEASGGTLAATYFGAQGGNAAAATAEPFALLHDAPDEHAD